MYFNVTLQKKRMKKQLSMEEFSNKTGISTITLIKYENGSATPTLESFVKLCETLEESPNEMLKDVSFLNLSKSCECRRQNKARQSMRLLNMDEKVQYVQSLRKRGVRIYPAHLQRKMGIGYDEAQELLVIVDKEE